SMVERDLRSATSTYTYGRFGFTLSYDDKARTDIRELSRILVTRDGSPFAHKDFTGGFGFGGIGVYEMGLEEPVLVMATYSGGAHCCTHFNLLPLASQSTWTAAGGFDGDVFALEDVD